MSKDSTRLSLKKILDSVADPIFVKDREHRWIDGNTAFWRLMNKTPEEIIGRSDYEFFPKEEADIFWAKDEEVFTTGKENINIESFTDFSGNKRILSTKKSCFTDEDGKLVLVGIIRDITELRKIEEKLKQTDDARLRSIMNFSGRPVYIKDRNGKYLQANTVFLEINNLSESQVLGRTDSEIFPSAEAVTWQNNDRQVIEKAEPMEFEETCFQNGALRTYTSVKFPLYDASQEVYALCGISTDITERKQAEETLKKMMEELKRANTELERFAYICSHDLQEPLRTISSFTQLLEKHLATHLDEKATKYMNFITEASARARDLISEVLNYARLDIDTEKQHEVDVNEVISAIKDNLGVRLKEAKAVITQDAMPIVFGNKTQLIQLFQNLIQNAIKFRGDAQPALHIGVSEDDNCWKFSVKDNGIGIAPAYQQKIFEIFQRLHKRNEYPGTGIGLAICKKIVERHNGTIWVESELGKGSIFYFTLSKNEQ